MARPAGSKNGTKKLTTKEAKMPEPKKGSVPEAKLIKEGDEKEDKWEIEEAVRTLARAEEIKGDAKMMKRLAPHLKNKIMSIEGLKKHYDELCQDC
jgi:hypothetical protein